MTNQRPSQIVHHVAVGLGGEGFRAICSCGWRSAVSWERRDVSQAGGEHKRQSRAEDLQG